MSFEPPVCEAEIEVIKELAPQIGIKQTAFKLDRAPWTIRKHCKLLGIQWKKSASQLSEAEIEQIRQLVPQIGIGKTADKLRRAPETISKAAKRLDVEAPRSKLSEAEIEQIRQLVPRIGPAKTGKLIGRHMSTVAMHARRIGACRVGFFWGEEDDAELEQRWPTQTVTAIARAMNRTPGQISGRAHRLGLRKTEAERVQGVKDFWAVHRVRSKRSKRRIVTPWVKRQAAAFMAWRNQQRAATGEKHYG